MKVLKCDRCGKFYTEKGGKIKIDKRPPKDLCPECKKELQEWIGDKEDEE